LCKFTNHSFVGAPSGEQQIRVLESSYSAAEVTSSKSCGNVQHDWSPWTDETTHKVLSAQTLMYTDAHFDCMEMCNRDAACKAWSWQQQTTTTGICRLFSSWNSVGRRTDGGTWIGAECSSGPPSPPGVPTPSPPPAVYKTCADDGAKVKSVFYESGDYNREIKSDSIFGDLGACSQDAHGNPVDCFHYCSSDDFANLEEHGAAAYYGVTQSSAVPFNSFASLFSTFNIQLHNHASYRSGVAERSYGIQLNGVKTIYAGLWLQTYGKNNDGPFTCPQKLAR